MRKKNTLYTVNKHNKALFVGEKAKPFPTENLFWNGGSALIDSSGNVSTPPPSFTNNEAISQRMQDTANDATINYLTNSLTSNSEGNTSGVAAGGSNFNFGKTALGMVSSIPSNEIKMGDKTWKRGLWDMLDPGYNAGFTKFDDGTTGHYETNAGNFLGDAGVTLTKVGTGMGSQAGGYVALAGAALKNVGNIINNGWGYAYNDKAIVNVENNAKRLRRSGRAFNDTSNSGNFFDAVGQMGTSSGYKAGDLVKGGTFVKGKATKKGQKYIDKENRALAYQDNSMFDSAQRIDDEMDSAIMRNFGAFGGPLDVMSNNSNMGAIEYGFMSDYLATKKKQADDKNKMTNMFMGTPSTLFAIGGDMQTNSADYSVGKVYEVSKEEANRLKAMGYEFEYIN